MAGGGGQSKYKNTAYNIIAAQIVLTLAIAGVLWGWVGAKSAHSAIIGGAINVISGFYLATRLFRFDSKSTPERILRAFYVGEAVKYGLTVALFAYVIVFLDTDLRIVFSTFIVTMAVYWFALLGPMSTPGAKITKRT